MPAAIGWLRRRIRSDWSVLELGSGRSTVWFARRAGGLSASRTTSTGSAQTRERMAELGSANVELRLRPVEDFPGEVAALPDDSFDLVVVDFLEAPSGHADRRARPALKKVRPGGYLLLDDSDRPGYAEAFELLDGWRFRAFTGVKDEWPEACETGDLPARLRAVDRGQVNRRGPVAGASSLASL